MATKEDSDGAVGGRPATLEEFLIACQKGLARSAVSASEAGKADSEFAQGERPVYVVEGLDIDLSAGLRLHAGEDCRSPDRVLLDFDAPAEQRSRLRFRVESRPVEILVGAKLELANLDPLGEDLPLIRLRVWLVDDKGSPVPNHEVLIRFARASDKKRSEVEVKTNIVGRVDFFIETDKAEKNLKVVGVRKRFTVHTRGSGRGRAADELYVWASCERKEEWQTVVEPNAPRPPREADREGADATVLNSELIRLTLC